MTRALAWLLGPWMRIMREAEEELAPGVWGLVADRPSGLYLLTLRALEPGKGAVGRYLDSLPRDRLVKALNVSSPIAKGMLERRGFHPVATSLFTPRDTWERYPPPREAQR